MNTEIMNENRYVETLRKKKLKLTAQNLLHVMRPEVEDILIRHGKMSPPSQSIRASQLLAELRLTMAPPISGVRPFNRVQSLRFSEEDTLRYFMAVHRTVHILEGKPV